MIKECNRAWAEVNLDNIVHNLQEIRRLVGTKTKIMAVVKADAYGHGAVEVSKTLLKNGADRLAVGYIDEAIQLRANGISAPIQILSHTFPDRVNEILEYDVIQTIFNMELASELSRVAGRKKKKLKIHVKVDSGMGRLGFPCEGKTVEKIIQISRMPWIEVEGIMTHFASADEDDCGYTLKQFELFMKLCAELDNRGVYIAIRHAANSAATINYPQMHLDMVRPGIAIYGLYSGILINKCTINLKPAIALKARVINIKQLNKGAFISYGRTYKTKSKRVIATISIGYADGYPRGLSNRSKVIINGKIMPLVGTICMDHCMTDVTEIKDDIYLGQEAVLFGRQDNNEIAVDEIAKTLGTINYEIVCKIGLRVPRIYYENNKFKNVGPQRFEKKYLILEK